MKITHLKNGRLSTKVYVGTDAHGKQITRRFTADTVNELKKMVIDAKYRMTTEVIQQRNSSILLRDAFDQFITARTNTLSQTTLRAYQSIRDSSFHQLMEMPVDEISSEDIQREINAMIPLLSPKTIKNKVSLLHSVLEIYSQNAPQRQLHMPVNKREDAIKIPSREDVQRMLDFCHNDEYYREYELPIFLGAYCGLRRGEIGALTYQDIDFKKCSLNVSKAQILDTDHEHTIKSPKTLAGYRTLPLNDEIMSLIKQRKKEGLPLIGVNVSQISSVFKTIKKHTGVDCRFHDLRHFFASLLLANNVPDLYAIELTGHSTTGMLKSVYQHTMKSKQEEVRDLVRDLYSK